MFAIIETGGKQYQVEKGQIFDIERIEEKEGATIHFDKVFLIHDGKDTKVGTPIVKGGAVSAKVVLHKRGEKIVVFKMKAKKRYQKTQGHRQELTTVEILDIKASGAKAETTEKGQAEKAPVEKPVKKAPATTANEAAPAKKPTAKKAPAKKKATV